MTKLLLKTGDELVLQSNDAVDTPTHESAHKRKKQNLIIGDVSGQGFGGNISEIVTSTCMRPKSVDLDLEGQLFVLNSRKGRLL